MATIIFLGLITKLKSRVRTRGVCRTPVRSFLAEPALAGWQINKQKKTMFTSLFVAYNSLQNTEYSLCTAVCATAVYADEFEIVCRVEIVGGKPVPQNGKVESQVEKSRRFYH